ncbi:anti-sigma factor antagonist [Planobispora rosea]|uniref:Anti-sigma factor antagonist n=1 Tax=Planobispora rosea TaxID=35762 RepID=A0A8J3W9D8_PLARO|nr:STAS domain-containing protein [Planobispora rosea]GGS73510.1 anti-sigma factor antagonist [Planobispora rosea]GIH81619.1 anti-sigma factor antagonist [Planobispora rosea]
MLFAPGSTRFTVTAALHRDSEAVILQAGGELDIGSAPILREQLGRVWELPDVAVLIVDLADLTFCDSVGLSELVRALKRSEAGGTRLILTGVGDLMTRVLTITGLRKVFEIHPSTADALRASAGPEDRRGNESLSPVP